MGLRQIVTCDRCDHTVDVTTVNDYGDKRWAFANFSLLKTTGDIGNAYRSLIFCPACYREVTAKLPTEAAK